MLMVSKSGRRNAISHYRNDTRILAGFFTNCDASSTQRRKQCLPALLVHIYICVMLQRLRIHVPRMQGKKSGKKDDDDDTNEDEHGFESDDEPTTLNAACREKGLVPVATMRNFLFLPPSLYRH